MATPIQILSEKHFAQRDSFFNQKQACSSTLSAIARDWEDFLGAKEDAVRLFRPSEQLREGDQFQLPKMLTTPYGALEMTREGAWCARLALILEIEKGTWPKALYWVELQFRVIDDEVVVQVTGNPSRERFESGNPADEKLRRFSNRVTRIFNKKVVALESFFDKSNRAYRPLLKNGKLND
ncbi:MAG: hypothetical protein NUW21_14425 [Elusimicrobia bacterium]|nr:hypothetical protein [Elusimicrobiota bacterium]